MNNKQVVENELVISLDKMDETEMMALCQQYIAAIDDSQVLFALLKKVQASKAAVSKFKRLPACRSFS